MRRHTTLWAPLAALLGCALVALLGQVNPAQGKRHGRATRGLDCSSCHTPASWGVRNDLQLNQTFDHDLTGFPLRAGHKAAACVQCHDGRANLSRECADCHRDDHQGKLGRSCDTCHNAISFKATDTFKIHSRTRLPLSGMHVLVDCNDCHRRMSSEGYATTPSQCFACHEQDYRRPDVHPVHDGSGGSPPFSRNCAECHRTDAFSPAVINADQLVAQQNNTLMFDVRAHDRSFMLSSGSHRGAPCASCHVEMREPRMVRCTSCHAHSQGALAAQHKRTGTPTDGSCLGCHAGGAPR